MGELEPHSSAKLMPMTLYTDHPVHGHSPDHQVKVQTDADYVLYYLAFRSYYAEPISLKNASTLEGLVETGQGWNCLSDYSFIQQCNARYTAADDLVGFELNASSACDRASAR